MSRPAGKCVWCGGVGLTKSHVWADWLVRLMDFAEDHQHKQTQDSFSHGVPLIPVQEISVLKQGSALARKPRNTCLRCNSGWMSRIEVASIPIAKPLILGHPCIIDTMGRWHLAAFLCLISMRLAFLSRSPFVLTEEDRKWLMEKGEPPAGWAIWIGRIADKPFDEHWTLFSALVRPSSNERDHHVADTQCTTIVIGNLCAHVVRLGSWLKFRGYSGIILTDLWPPSQFEIDSLGIPTLSHDVARALHHAFRQDPIVEAPETEPGGNPE